MIIVFSQVSEDLVVRCAFVKWQVFREDQRPAWRVSEVEGRKTGNCLATGVSLPTNNLLTAEIQLYGNCSITNSFKSWRSAFVIFNLNKSLQLLGENAVLFWGVYFLKMYAFF